MCIYVLPNDFYNIQKFIKKIKSIEKCFFLIYFDADKTWPASKSYFKYSVSVSSLTN